jgi:hypothetical protein
LDRKIRVGAVSYLNTKPLLYGIERAPIRSEIELIIDYPASIATMFLNDAKHRSKEWKKCCWTIKAVRLSSWLGS